MPALSLTAPVEPTDLKTTTRQLLEHAPVEGLAWLSAGYWIAGPLWQAWREALEPRGCDAERLLQIVRDYRNELRLWVMGERPWEQCVAGLAGRVARRVC
jgi:hypothetical protein